MIQLQERMEPLVELHPSFQLPCLASQPHLKTHLSALSLQDGVPRLFADV